MIKVLIVDDSPTLRLFLERIFSDDPDLQVVGAVGDGEEAVAAVRRLAPDVITMDIHMPGINGLETTRRIMETNPTPIIILSGNLDAQEIASSFRAMEAGALTAVPKPKGPGYAGHEDEVKSLLRTVKLMAEIKVVKRWPRAGKAHPSALPSCSGSTQFPVNPQVIAIGASTGGPVVIQTILSALGKDFPLPVLVVQHMADGFIDGFAAWLALSSSLPVHIASQDEQILPGHVYIAPDDYHMVVQTAGRISLVKGTTHSGGLRPSVSRLFRSVADVYGRNAVAILLTGMGNDGAQELKLLKSKGAVTMAQDRESSVIHGMPGEAIKLDAADYVLPPEKIAAAVQRLITRR